jgi:hypothetical protein
MDARGPGWPRRSTHALAAGASLGNGDQDVETHCLRERAFRPVAHNAAILAAGESAIEPMLRER